MFDIFTVPIGDTLVEMLSFPFMVRALIVGVLIAMCAALLGVSLVLKRYSMIGDGLSHVGFGALAVAVALGVAPLKVSIPIVILAAFFLLRISENSKIKGDAAIAVISTSALAIGVIIISVSGGMTMDVFSYMFGSILAMSASDVQLSIVLSVLVIFMFLFLYNKIFAITFDEGFAKASGTNTGFYNMLIASMTAITIVLEMRMMGAMLISSLIIFPALTAMRVCKRFSSVTVLSALISVVCFLIGIYFSYISVVPAGASVVMVNLAALILFSLIGFVKEKIVMDK